MTEQRYSEGRRDPSVYLDKGVYAACKVVVLNYKKNVRMRSTCGTDCLILMLPTES